MFMVLRWHSSIKEKNILLISSLISKRFLITLLKILLIFWFIVHYRELIPVNYFERYQKNGAHVINKPRANVNCLNLLLLFIVYNKFDFLYSFFCRNLNFVIIMAKFEDHLVLGQQFLHAMASGNYIIINNDL